MPILRRRCPIDGLEFDLLSVRGVLSALNHPDLDHLGCPTCGTEGYAVIASFLAKDLGGEAGVGKTYPYDDRGLGCHVRDAGHHRWLLTHHPDGTLRDAPLIPTHGDFDFESIADEQRRNTERQEAKYKAQMDEMMNGPNREAYGRLTDILRSKGAIEALWGEES